MVTFFSTGLTLSSLFNQGLRTLSLIHYLESTPKFPEKMPHAQLFLQPESLPQCVGLWRPQYIKPKHENQILEEAQRTVCTSLSLFELRFSSGLTRPCLPVILGSHAHLSFCKGAFGGLRLRLMLQPLSKPALCAIRARRHTFPLKVSYTPCP